MKLYFTYIIVLLNCNSLFSQKDTSKQKSYFFKMSIGIGTNIIRSENFHYLYITPPEYSDPVDKDYQITNFQTINPVINLAYSRLLFKTKSIQSFVDIESALFWNAEKYYAKGYDTYFSYNKHSIEKTISNYYSGFSTNLNLSLLKKFTNFKCGLFIGFGSGTNLFTMQKYDYTDITLNHKYKDSNSEFEFEAERIRVNLNFGLECMYKIRSSNLSTRLYTSPQISKTGIYSNKNFDFNTRNYLIIFSTSILL